MPAKSPEALRRKAENRRIRYRAAKDAARKLSSALIAPGLSSVARRRQMPKMADMSKSALRAMLTAAVVNTGATDADQA